MDNKRLLNTFLDLVKIYSPSKNEINVLNYIKDRLDKLKIKYILHDHCSDYGGNTPVLIAKLDKNEKGKNLKKYLFVLIWTLLNLVLKLNLI